MNGPTEIRLKPEQSKKIANDGSIKFKNADGLFVSEDADISRVISDDKNRPLRAEYPSGSNRIFEYNDDKLVSVTDLMKSQDKEKSTTWTRSGDSDKFESKDASTGKIRTREAIEPNLSGDYTYKTADGKDHISRAHDLERQSRGEIIVGSESMQEARDRFIETAEERGLKIDRLEKYLNELDATSKRYGSTSEQIAKAVDNLTDILSAENSKHYNKNELAQLAETGLHNIALPVEIDQGYHPTCNVTTTEIYAAAKFPDKYTSLLKQVALTGSFMTAQGKAVTPPDSALKPGRDEKTFDLDKSNVGKRNLASQVYQMTAVNGLYELGKHSSQSDGKDDGTRYIMGEARSKQIPNGSVDLGEDLLIDKNGKTKKRSNGDEIDGPGFTVDDNIAASEMIVGKKMPYIAGPTKLATEANWRFDLPSKERLLKAKADGQFPMGVPTIKGDHVQTIHDVTTDSSGKTWVWLDNQHGAKNDGWVTLEELHKTQTEGIELEPTRKPQDRPDGKK